MNADKHEFKKRQFVLHGEKLFYYKKGRSGESYFNLISLQNASITKIEPTQQQLKINKMYKYCFKLENEMRQWILACQNEKDLEQWVNAIFQQIDQFEKRQHMERNNLAIIDKEIEKSNIDAQTVNLRDNNAIIVKKSLI